jgi:hypothetical protein
MKSLFLLLALVLFYKIKAQNSENVGKISLAVVMPENIEGLEISQLSKIESKIIQLVSNNGMGAKGYNNNFVIYPKFEVWDEKTVESGMQDILVIDCQISFYIKQVDNNLIYGSINKSLRGNGKDKRLALTNAISRLNISDKDLIEFINSTKVKINKYYEENCERILSQATSLASSGELEKAIGILSNVPEEVSCYEKVKQKAVEVYKAYVNKICKQQINEANSHIAAQRYNQALSILSDIDPSSSCNADAKSAITKIEAKVSEQEKRAYDEKMERYKNSVELEKARINAVKEIAVAYYNRSQPTYNYLMIVR